MLRGCGRGSCGGERRGRTLLRKHSTRCLTRGKTIGGGFGLELGFRVLGILKSKAPDVKTIDFWPICISYQMQMFPHEQSGGFSISHLSTFSRTEVGVREELRCIWPWNLLQYFIAS